MTTLHRLHNAKQKTATEETALLLSWYDRNRRSLPWRDDPSPYHIWVSEIMLQQTRVEAAKNYYMRFLETLPDIASLAAAEEDTCLKLWQGLGYYSRIRNMRKAAIRIMDEYNGEMPQTPGELRKLPGIGEYTAAAIASIAFGYPAPAIDGNLLRIFSRKAALPSPLRAKETKSAAQKYYSSIIPEDRPGDYNQALMDLGAEICLSKGQPVCCACPWATHCTAHQQNRETDFPVTAPKSPRKKEARTVFIITDGTRVLLRRRPNSGLLSGMYELPNIEGTLEKESDAARFLLQSGIPMTRRLSGSNPEIPYFRINDRNCVLIPLPPAKHIFSHIEWHMIGWAAAADLSDFPTSPGAAKNASGIHNVRRSADTSGTTSETTEHSALRKDSAWKHQAFFAASPKEIESRYSIPSAFRSYIQQLSAVTSAAQH